jgi:hypothetical protein
MKTLKKIGLALLIATSMGTFSTASLAEVDPGRIAYGPHEAIDLVIGKIKAAVVAIKGGSDGTAVAPMIKEALDASKEVNANDVVDRNRMKANDMLKSARAHAKASSLQEAEQELEKAQKAFEALHGMV